MTIAWELVAIFTSSGVAMALLSCLFGMKPKLENPLWWALYALWIAVVYFQSVDSPFSTLLISSILAGLLHGTTSALLLDQYIANNPWHADKMQGPREKFATRFIVTGIIVGVVFGIIIGGIGWGISRI